MKKVDEDCYGKHYDRHEIDCIHCSRKAGCRAKTMNYGTKRKVVFEMKKTCLLSMASGNPGFCRKDCDLFCQSKTNDEEGICLLARFLGVATLILETIGQRVEEGAARGIVQLAEGANVGDILQQELGKK